MGNCVSNKNDVIEVRINSPNEKNLRIFNEKKNKKHKSVPVATFQFNKCPDFKKSNKSLKTLCLNDISEISDIMSIPDNEENVSINENNTFKQIIEVFNI